MPQVRSLFRNSALVSGLVPKEQLEETIHALVEAQQEAAAEGTAVFTSDVKDELLAKELVERKLITRYQADQLLNGRTLFNLGAYIITDFIGKGGMGDVFKAEHNLMGRQVAVKVLQRYRSTPEAEANFQREIRLQSKLDHPNLVRAYDAGHAGNVYYLVVEYVPGTDLRRLVRTQGKLDMQQAATVVMQAAQGLAHAHSQGMIHRDVKPGNLLVTPQGHTKVSDLGLAGFMWEGQSDPRAGKIVGTADYIAPEVYKSPTALTPVSDIYSLGCTLYYAVTGKVPYPGGSTREKLERHCNDTPHNPQKFNEQMSEEFVELIGDMMEKDVSRRMQTAKEAVERLGVWARPELASPTRAPGRWMPPLPTAPVEVLESEDLESPDTLSDRGADTLEPDGAPALPPLANPSEAASRWRYVLLTAAIVIPIAMCVGAAAMFFVLSQLRSM